MNNNNNKPHICDPENAAKILEWIRVRSGIAIWNSVDLSQAGRTWSTPVLDSEGKPVTKPHWAAGKIVRTITDPSEVEVHTPKEVKRFHVAIKRSGNGLAFKLTDASSKKVRDACAKVATEEKPSWYEFDYENQDAIIFVPGEVFGLEQFCNLTHKLEGVPQ